MVKNNNLIKKRGFLNRIEYYGNKLPHPIYIFMILALIVVVVSVLMAGTAVVHPGTGETEIVKSLMSKEGIVWILDNVVKNFINFPPLGMVLVMMIGLGLAEETGLLRTVIRKAIIGAPKTLVTSIIVFAGVMGSIAGSATFVVIPPLGGIIFKALGRHPIAGIAAGFSGVAGGLGANLLLTPTDVILAGITEKAANIIDPSYGVHPAVNWYFMIASTILLTIVGTIITEKVVEKRLGKYDSEYASEVELKEGLDDNALMQVSDIEKKGLRNAGIVTILYLIVIGILTIPPNAILRNPETGGLVPSPFLSSMIAILFLWFVVIALAYGITTKAIKNSSDVVNMMTTSMKSFAEFIVLCFFASQFVEFFSYSNIGLYLSVNGSNALLSSGLNGITLIIAFIIFAALANFLIGLASAKWALLAPVFVPMFMQLGMTPEYTQAAFRIADSVTNCISPLEAFIPFVIICCQRYDKRSGMGTVISAMMPYAIAYLVFWTLLLIGWTVFDLPLGPGAVINLK